MFKFVDIGVDGLPYYVDENENRCISYDPQNRVLYVGELGGLVKYYLCGVDLNMLVSTFDLVQKSGRYWVQCGDWEYELFPNAVMILGM